MSDRPSVERLQQLEQERDLYRRLLELGSQDRLDPFLEEALALVVEVTLAERGYLEFRDERSEDDEPAWWIAHGFSSGEIDDIRSRISRGIIAESLATGRTINTSSALLDPRFKERESVQAGRIEAVLCAPVGDNAALGVVYLQGRVGKGPFTPEDRERAELLARHLAPLSERLVARRRADETTDATRALRERHALEGVIGRSAALAAALEQAMLAAPLDVTVLLTGESGTGKSQLARAIHENSARSTAPLVEISCANIPHDLLESELFGAVAGAHSTAKTTTKGKVAAAEGGTLLLDEVGELPFECHENLLQLLQSRTYYPLGATTPSHADVRVIAATNSDLELAVSEKRFREDLFYRLQVLPIRLPALRERREDLEELSIHLGELACERHRLPRLELSRGALRAIESAEWPGHVRQLENAIEAAVVRAAGGGAACIEARHVFPGVEEPEPDGGALPTFQEATRRFQKEFLEKTLEETGWNVTEAARRLDLARSHVYNLIKAFELER